MSGKTTIILEKSGKVRKILDFSFLYFFGNLSDDQFYPKF